MIVVCRKNMSFVTVFVVFRIIIIYFYYVIIIIIIIVIFLLRIPFPQSTQITKFENNK